MQDNLEFLQWIKRFWDQNYPGGEYDALGRRKASGASPAARTGSAGGVRRGTTPSSVGRAGGLAATRAPSAAATQAQIREATAPLHEETRLHRRRLSLVSKRRGTFISPN
ncbi:Calponin-domain containing protein [Ascosphaera apis ARSEF 7405]|uniref:Calponin-domain containing protein n=1 Tax=Ascosphaera apis ARSEF 7405 TaxID=392613 RepID=A0A168CD21_9EURO|nr:Calponin-domain containing protein [Ascosphaera apis ARSEF 7405]